jgi:hypothetical protein
VTCISSPYLTYYVSVASSVKRFKTTNSKIFYKLFLEVKTNTLCILDVTAVGTTDSCHPR